MPGTDRANRKEAETIAETALNEYLANPKYEVKEVQAGK